MGEQEGTLLACLQGSCTSLGTRVLGAPISTPHSLQGISLLRGGGDSHPPFSDTHHQLSFPTITESGLLKLDVSVTRKWGSEVL